MCQGNIISGICELEQSAMRFENTSWNKSGHLHWVDRNYEDLESRKIKS